MEIDNFDIFREHLDFVDTKLDRYVIHILRRPKDISKDMKNALGANESQRLIKTYYVDSIEYFDRKIPAIKELCISNNARAYIIVQPKDNFECLLNLGEKIFETIRNKNYSVKPEHLVRQAFCEWHKTRKKQWILDLDEDSMVEYIDGEMTFGGPSKVTERKWTKDEVLDLVKAQLKADGKDENAPYVVKTKNGCHIITPPFNLQRAVKQCNLLFEGVKKFKVGTKEWWLKRGDRGFTGSPGLDHKYESIYKEVVGWLHKDGMSLLYMNIPS